jgi:transposase
MAYGKGAHNLQRRAIPTGKTMLTPAVLSAGKLSDLLLLRAKYIETANTFVDLVFNPEPLVSVLDAEAMHARLLASQKKMTRFNKAYIEKIRLAIPNAIAQVEMRYRNKLAGRLLHCASKTGEKDPAKRQYLNIPVEVQDKITLADLEALEKKVAKLSYRKVLDLYRQVVIDEKADGLTETEVLVIRTIHTEVKDRYRKPEFGKDQRFTCQLHLDYRVVKNQIVPTEDLEAGARILVDRNNSKYYHFLEISNPLPRGAVIRIPVVMSSKSLKRFDEESKVSSLIVEIGTDAVTIRSIISKPDTEPTLDNVTHLVGRDFGMVNTLSLTVVEMDKPISQEEIDQIKEFTKEESLAYLQEHHHPNDNIVKRIRFSGRKFLASINTICEKIDRTKGQIDSGYNKIAKLKAVISGHLGLEPHKLIVEGMIFKDQFVQKLYDKFFRLLKHVQKMKGIRLNLYSKIAGIKKAWFGFVSNQEALLAKHFSAAVVREDLTILAKEKDSPDYKGRTYNKMINNGSKGQYIRRASDKLLWDGVPEITIPSYYTSTACTIHSHMDSKMRVGEIFRCPMCASSEHSDEHAADTIANFLLLRPHHAQ